MTNVNRSSVDDGLPPPWLIVTGTIGALALVFLLGLGAGQEWGAEQWGPVASWFAGALTLAAVIVALRQAALARRESMRLQLARLVDHEVSRRRECIEALANLWAAITGMQMEFAAWTEYLGTLPESFDPRQQHRPAPRGAEQTWGMETREEMRRFSSEWQNRIEPPLFVALLVLRGTALYEAVGALNETINDIKAQGLEPIREALTDGRRPDNEPIIAMWSSVIGCRSEHLTMARQHFSLTREDVERYV
jgi:hypothetical protein